jgi:hypothetical protein
MVFRIALLVWPFVAAVGVLLLGDAVGADPVLTVTLVVWIAIVGGAAIGLFGDRLFPERPRRRAAHRTPSLKP